MHVLAILYLVFAALGCVSASSGGEASAPLWLFAFIIGLALSIVVLA